MNDDRMQEIYQLQQHIRSLNTALPIDSITLRDFFAASAMQGLIARETRLNPDLGMYAGAAYNISDAMIEARKK